MVLSGGSMGNSAYCEEFFAPLPANGCRIEAFQLG
jgi:hypothetical protein